MGGRELRGRERGGVGVGKREDKVDDVDVITKESKREGKE